jgi:hypothetical protein
MYNLTLPEMPAHFARWGDPNNVQAYMDGYSYYHQLFSDELACRPDNMRNHLQSAFNLPQQVPVELDVFPANTGRITISTVSPEEYPWNGIYFDGVPVKIEAQSLPGYVFSHWESNGLITDTLNAVFLDTLSTSAVSFRAHFIQAVGVNETRPSAMRIYPNPASESVTIGLTESALDMESLHVYDLLGKEHRLGGVRNGTEILLLDCSSLESGYYIIQCSSADGRAFRGEFVKE